jgi:hypothetical protein
MCTTSSKSDRRRVGWVLVACLIVALRSVPQGNGFSR